MKAYVIALIACGSAVAACIILFCLSTQPRPQRAAKGNKPHIRRPSRRVLLTPPLKIPHSKGIRSPATTSPAPRAYRDVEKGQGTQSRGTKAGEMVILAGAGAAIATTAIVASEIVADHGGGGGGGCGGGGCGGG